MTKKIIFTILILIALISFSSNTYASSENKDKGHQEQAKDGHKSEDTHKGTPVLYYAYWLGLCGVLFFSGKYILQAFDKGIRGVDIDSNDILLVLKLVSLAIFIYAIDQASSMKHFHEITIVGFVKFILKFAAGIAMMIYSFSGMEENKHH